MYYTTLQEAIDRRPHQALDCDRGHRSPLAGQDPRGAGQVLPGLQSCHPAQVPSHSQAPCGSTYRHRREPHEELAGRDPGRCRCD